jgi:hypothetical protein
MRVTRTRMCVCVLAWTVQQVLLALEEFLVQCLLLSQVLRAQPGAIAWRHQVLRAQHGALVCRLLVTDFGAVLRV